MTAFNFNDAKKKEEIAMKKGGFLCKCAECGNTFRAIPKRYFYVECPICGEDTNGMVNFIKDIEVENEFAKIKRDTI